MPNNQIFLNSKVFTPEKPLNNTNQLSFRLNYLSQFLSQQIKQNENINNSFKRMEETINQTQQIHDIRIDQILQDQKEQTDTFLQKVEFQGKTNEDILLSLQQLQNDHFQFKESLQSDHILNQVILDQLCFQEQQLRRTNSEHENYFALAEQLSEQLVNQDQLLKEMQQKLDVQDVYHSTVMSKLEKQDAINEKIIRQLDHLKSIVYERVNLIVEKVENSYKSTTDYFNDIFNKSGFIKPFLLTSRQKDKKEENNVT